MEQNRAKCVDENFSKYVLATSFPEPASATTAQEAGLDKTTFLDLFDSQLTSRHLDILARELREKQLGFYTIGSSGHESNAAIAKAFNVDDIAFLHYRSGAFMLQRAKAYSDIDAIYDQVLSLVASSDDLISGGRHKVFGSAKLLIPPQTSTIASHLPKALGCALSLTYKPASFNKLPQHSVVLCSFGDASCNHSTAQGAFNSAQWIVNANLPLPLVWICEDNGIGISVPTPDNWIEKIFSQKPGLHYLPCDGLNLADVYLKAKQANQLARKKAKPVFLHMKTVRLLGHAGSDIEFQYHSLTQIEENERQDPLLHSARIICEQNWLTPEEIVLSYERVREKVNKASERALLRPKLMTAKEIMSSIVPPRRQASTLPLSVSQEDREHCFGKQFLQINQRRTLAQCLNMALTDIMLTYPNTLIFGEDVGKKGGVYRITADLQARFGSSRVFDTLLDEQTILGTAIGFAHNGYIPIPEIQFLAYTINAFDQIRAEAATLSFFSKGQFTNPMVIRIPSLAYQKGFGGHFHNDNGIGFLREIPGLVIACPSNGQDGALLLRECIRLAYEEQRVVVFLEPIALYMTKDLHQAGDNLALCHYPSLEQSLDFGKLGIEGENSDTVIISYGNGMHLSRQAAHILEKEHQIKVKLIDLRWLAPINTEELAKELQKSARVIIVDEGRRTGSLSEYLVTWMAENFQSLPKVKRVVAQDCFIPLGKAWEAILPSRDDIVKTILEII